MVTSYIAKTLFDYPLKSRSYTEETPFGNYHLDTIRGELTFEPVHCDFEVYIARKFETVGEGRMAAQNHYQNLWVSGGVPTPPWGHDAGLELASKYFDSTIEATKKELELTRQQLSDARKVMRQQAKGLQRQARRISELDGSLVSPEDV